jgi:drug/metabolite transporter (DMT)-like permease
LQIDSNLRFISCGKKVLYMKLKIAVAISVVSIIMLCIYGLDVIVANDGKTGFLPMNVSVRGSIFGIIPSALLIISFLMTRKEPSKKLGALIISGGILIIAGTGIILALQGGTHNQDSRAIREFGAVLGIGVIITILGILKIKKS